MPYSWNVAQLLAKAESAEGTAIALADADAKIQVRNPSVNVDIPFHNRNIVAATAGDFKGTGGGPRTIGLSFECPLFGSGTAGTPPAVGLLFRAGGLLCTNVAGTSDTYKPSSTFEAITIALNVNGMEFKAHGAKVTKMTLNLATGAPPFVAFDVLGVYNEPSAVAASAPTYETNNPVAISGGAMTLDSLAMKYSSLIIEISNDAAVRPAPALAPSAFSIHAAPGIPHITGSIDPEMEVPGTYNFFSKMTTSASGALSLVIGATPGNIITITAPVVQYTAPKPERREHTLIVASDLLFCRSSGGDALSIAFT